MGDLISRQDAIDALNEYFARIWKLKKRGLTKGEKAISLDTVGAIKTLPTVQPERTEKRMETHACDLISRQALCEYALNQKDKSVTPNDIMRFPSAQPEPQEGHWIEGKIYRDVIECYCSECGQIMTTAASVRMNYCPNCGAKMRGERQK